MFLYLINQLNSGSYAKYKVVNILLNMFYKQARYYHRSDWNKETRFNSLTKKYDNLLKLNHTLIEERGSNLIKEPKDTDHFRGITNET